MQQQPHHQQQQWRRRRRRRRRLLLHQTKNSSPQGGFDDDEDDDEDDDDYYWREPQSRYSEPPPNQKPLDYYGNSDYPGEQPMPDGSSSRGSRSKPKIPTDEQFRRMDTTSKDPIEPLFNKPSSSSSSSSSSRGNNNMKRKEGYQYYDDDDDDDDYYYYDKDDDDKYDDDDDDEYDDDDEEEAIGNFWSNPPARYDPVNSREPRRRVPRPNEPAPLRPRSQRTLSTNKNRNNGRPQTTSRGRRGATFRSGTPAPPPVVGDFYKQLFWYGFDPDDSSASSPADKTMFGGTKGKFNGLAYLLDNALDPNPRPTRPQQQPRKQQPGMDKVSLPSQRQRRRRRTDNYYDDEDYDDDDDQEDDEVNFKDTLGRISKERAKYHDDDIGDDDDGPPPSTTTTTTSSSKRFETQDDDDAMPAAAYNNINPHDKYYFVTPPNDQPRPIIESMRRDYVDPVTNKKMINNNNNNDGIPNRRKRRPRKSPWEEDENDRTKRTYDDRRYYDDHDDDDDDDGYISQQGDWVSKEVSNWFRDDDDYDDDDESNKVGTSNRRRTKREQQERRPRSRNRSGSPLWVSPFQAVGNLLGLGSEELNYQAEMYNRKMGLGPSEKRYTETNGRRRRRPQERRKGYAYRYDVDLSDYDSVVDADVVADDSDDDEPIPARSRNGKVMEDSTVVEQSPDTTIQEPGTNGASPKKQPQGAMNKERSWEERALARERIPPPGVPAWGPSGDLGMDARMKVTIDALQDIQDAQHRLKQREKREQQAMDDITILKVDIGVKKRRLAASKQEARNLREDIRALELEIDDAARYLRKAQSQVQFARDRLSELENRHWAVLSLYSPAQAEIGVAEALRELEENEPAARLQKRDGSLTENAEGGATLSVDNQ